MVRPIGRPMARKAVTLEDLRQEFLAHCEARNLSGRTVEWYGDRTRRFTDWCTSQGITSRTRRLFTLFNTHMKSHFLSPGETAADANGRRQRQAEVAATIIEAQTRPNSSFVVTGDMNDPPNSQFLTPLVASPGLRLVDGLTNPTETRPAPADTPPPATSA